MASISTDNNGLRRILFVNKDGDRKAVRLGKVPMKLANEIKLKVECITAAQSSGLSMDNETAAWVARIGDELASKLSAVGLIPPRQATRAERLQDYFTAYIDGRVDVATNSKRNMHQAVRY